MIPNAGAAGEGSGVTPFTTLSSLLSTAPQPGMRAAASAAPGSMLYEVGGKWGGSLGSVSQATLDSLTAGELAQLAGGETPTFGSYADLSALGSSIPIGVVDGTVYAWSETLGRHVPGVPMSTDVYDSYLDLVADRPVGDFIGQRFKVKCFLGDSYYDAEWSGTRWGIPRYECPVRLDAKIPIVSTSGDYARAAVAAIGPLIGDYETWEFAAMARNTGTHSGSGALIVNTTGNTTIIGSSSPIGTVNTRARRVGILRRIGNNLIRMSGFGLSFSSASTAADIVVANWSAFEIECGMQTFAVGDTYSIEEFIVRRIA